MEQLNKDLVLLKSMPNAPPEEIYSKEYEIKAIKKVLLKLGANDDDVDQLKQTLQSLQVRVLYSIMLNCLKVLESV